jgi:ferredoxin-NADP reductase
VANVYERFKEVAMATDAVPVACQTSKLRRREDVAEGTMAFHFQKPSGFQFKAGQFADVTLTDPPETDAEGNTRTFSIASPPFENELVFTTRMRDTAFKRSLRKVPLATEVKIGSAAGSFTLHKNPAKPAVFLAGGIGITPFLSIVRQADKDRLPQKLYLFYSNRRPEDAAFLDTLQTLETTNPNFRLICTMTEMSKSKKEWKGETVLIDKEMLSRHLSMLQGPIYYIAGPPAMVAAMRQTLVSAGIEEDDIRAEEFAGY